MNFWHIQLHRGEGDRPLTPPEKVKEILNTTSYIGLGDWDNGQEQIRQFKEDLQEGDIVAVRDGQIPIALVEVTGKPEYEDEPNEDFDWFEHRRKVKVLDFYKKEENDFIFPAPRGTFSICRNLSAPTSKVIIDWYKRVKKYSPEEIKKEFNNYLLANANTISDNSRQTYLTNIDSRVLVWAKNHKLVRNSIYEVYLPEKVDNMFDELEKLEDVKINNNAFFTPMNWYRKFSHEFIATNKNDNTTVSMTSKTTSLNTILYGPPGTGKTYHSIDYAVTIATGKPGEHSENKTIFDALRKIGQIEFVTFHQNYTYEDFMVGLKPDTDNSATLTFKKHKGIFHEIAKRARDNYYDSLKDAKVLSYEAWAKEMFENFKDYVIDIIEKEGKFTVKNHVSIFSVEEDAFIYTGEKSDGEKWKNERLGMHYEPLLKMFLSNITERKNIKHLEGIPSLEKQHATYCFEVLQKFKEYLRNSKNEFSEKKNESQELKKYVLIIDEINRANISKVFGELITLLEDDKRLGEENELKIKLPNGEEDFGIPPNLYLIGTMNTADKSIALIDIALRRRFEFKGYYPDNKRLSELESKGLLTKEARELLMIINNVIYEKKNKCADYLIGHAYFMKDQTIEEVLENKVIPLLMEYFSGKIDIVEKIFEGTAYTVKYQADNYKWGVNKGIGKVPVTDNIGNN